MFKKINIQFLISYFGLIPYAIVFLDKYYFLKIKEIIQNNILGNIINMKSSFNIKAYKQKNFFGIKIEAVKIGNSDIAVNFKVISQPNEWIKTRSNYGYRCSGKLTPSKILKQDFWTHLNNKIQIKAFLSSF